MDFGVSGLGSWANLMIEGNHGVSNGKNKEHEIETGVI